MNSEATHPWLVVDPYANPSAYRHVQAGADERADVRLGRQRRQRQPSAALLLQRPGQLALRLAVLPEFARAGCAGGCGAGEDDAGAAPGAAGAAPRVLLLVLLLVLVLFLVVLLLLIAPPVDAGQGHAIMTPDTFAFPSGEQVHRYCTL